MSGCRGSCNYFFITGKTKMSQGEANITRKCGLYRTGKSERCVQPIVVSAKSPPKKKEPKPKSEDLRRRTGGKKYDWGQFRALWEEGKPDTEIARAVGCSPDTVSRWRHREGLAPRYRHEIDKGKLKRLWEAGMDDPNIAQRLGISKQSVWRARTAMGLPAQKERVKG